VATESTASAERRAKRDRKRILDLEAKRRKLLQAHLGGAVPIDLLREEQDRITKELANAGASLANTELHWETLEKNLSAALGLVSRFGEAYRQANKNERRWFNRAVVERIEVDIDGEVRSVVVAEPFRTLVDKRLTRPLTWEMKNRRPLKDGGSTIVKLVEAKGLEPSNLLTASEIFGVQDGQHGSP
jgi:hypothetical protein